MSSNSRVYAKIDLDAVEYNLQSMRDNLKKGTKMVCVIKTDGYGHGALPIARLAEHMEDIWGFAVATAEEGEALRKGGITKPILILGYTFPESYGDLVRLDIRPAVFTKEMAQALSDEAQRQVKIAPVHIALDTGMSRIGYEPTEESADEVQEIAALPGIAIEGLFTHFSRADEADKTFTKGQFEKYMAFVDMLENRGIHIPMRHCSNSAGIVDMPELNLDAVRAGITLYGLYPSEEVNKAQVPLRPVMELKSHIAYIKTLPAGRLISYGGTYETKKELRVATIPVGYGDGYPRQLSNKGWVLIHGKKAPILGRVCMDQFMVDVTDIPEARQHDQVTLVGQDGDAFLPVETLSELSGRFNYEFVCCVGKRVPRVYYRKGVPVPEQ